MNNLEQAIKDYDSTIDEYYADGFYPGVQEQEIIKNLEYNVLKEAKNSVNDIKALKIIIKKYVDIYILESSETVEEYNERICKETNFGMDLTKEEFKLLKEVLEWVNISV